VSGGKDQGQQPGEGNAVMAKNQKGKARSKSRRRKRELAEPIPDTFENVVAAVLNSPPKKDWRYLEQQHRS